MPDALGIPSRSSTAQNSRKADTSVPVATTAGVLASARVDRRATPAASTSVPAHTTTSRAGTASVIWNSEDQKPIRDSWAPSIRPERWAYEPMSDPTW